MAKQSPTLYSVAKTFMWFAITSIALTLLLGAIVWQDYKRPWKDFQKAFVRLKLEKAQQELKEADASVDKNELERLKNELTAAREQMRSHEKDRAAAEATVSSLDTKAARQKADYQTQKQYEDSYRYYFEELRHRGDPKAERYRRRLDALSPKVAALKRDLDGTESELVAARATVASFSEKQLAIQKEIDRLTEQSARIERRIEKIRPTLATEVLNAPMLDFVAPSLRIQQVVLDDLFDDYHFAKTQKVDRCMTCHLGIDQKGFEDAPQPFRTHPNLDLYLGSNSPHALEKFGCTTCHGGNGHSVSFKDSAHEPRDEAQAADWKKKYGWAELHHWDDKMVPMDRIEASCAKCHRDTVEVPKAPVLNEGRRLAEVHGCFGCHKVAGFEDAWKAGPSLEKVGSKTDAEWIARWLSDPKAFRPSTKMPAIFHRSNKTGPSDRALDDAAIAGITAYLMKHSSAATLDKPPVAGDAANGEKLVKTLGCTGCHSATAGADPAVNAGDYGPELSSLGTKTSADWVYTWVKDPKRIDPNTRMPNLRLSDQEAADITAYLTAQKNEPFEASPAPSAAPEAVDELAMMTLTENMRESQAREELAKMSQADKLEFVGKKAIAYQGCYGCHRIPGFEDAKPIGTELSDHGRKLVAQLDFGFADLPHTREAFYEQKLRDPRLFDAGKLKRYHEKLRMPHFDLTEGEVSALTTFLLSLTQEEVPLEMQKRLDSHEQAVQKGARLVHRYNCTGCHQIGDVKAPLREATEDKGQAPPILNGQGAKVQEKWLHEFLRAPYPIRTWIKYRMPTFALTDEEMRAIVDYFAGLDRQQISYNGYLPPATTPEKIAAGKQLFETLQCAKCHQVSAESIAMGASFLAPDLKMATQRLKPDWNVLWLKDPQAVTEGTMMPGFFPDGQTPLPDILGGDVQAQMEAIRDYLYSDEYRRSGAIAKPEEKR